MLLYKLCIIFTIKPELLIIQPSIEVNYENLRDELSANRHMCYFKNRGKTA